MRRYLVVANQTLGGPNLRRAVKRRLAKGPCHFHVLVPVPHPTTAYASVMAAYEGEVPGNRASVAEAQTRLDYELEWLRAAGADADGEVGDPDPLEAIRAAVDHGHFDEIILATLPAGISRWLSEDLPSRVKRHVSVPVTAISGAAPPPWEHEA
jgi:predicted TIM-barrel enzyme